MDYRIEEITKQLRSDITIFPRVTSAAKSINMSVSYFHHLFKQETAVTFAHYVRNKKLEEAAVLLETSYFSVKEIVVKVDGGDETNFIRAFKQKFSQTPSEYRRTHRIEHL